MQSTPDTGVPVSYGAIFTLFFVTLGPLKVLGPFAQLTREADETTMRKIAVRAFVIALIAVLVGGFLGRAPLQVALAVEMILRALRELGFVHG